MTRAFAIGVILVAGCSKSSSTPPPAPVPHTVVQRSCEPTSKQARLAIADGGYRRVSSTEMSALRHAADEARRARFRSEQVLRSVTGEALAAAILDLRDEVRACVATIDAPSYKVHAVIRGHLDVGAFVGGVEVRRLDDPTAEAEVAVRDCVANILRSISLPASDSGEFEMPLEFDARCVDTLPAKRRAD